MTEDNQIERLCRPTVPEMDRILGQKFPVLDDGFVRVIDYMGSDQAVVQAARVSYGAGTKKTSADRGLIRYLLRHRHTTPFEMCELKLHVRVPMDCWRQWIRHRTANVNEYSTRYSLAIDAAQQTAPDQWRSQAQDNKQGSGGFLDEQLGRELTSQETKLQQLARTVYQQRIEKGVAREQARKDLPLATYTEAYWKMDLHNLLHFLSLRMDSHAQFEIRQYAEVIGRQIVKNWVPLTWQAFEDYWHSSMYLSAQEVTIISLLTAQKTDAAQENLRQWGWVKPSDDPAAAKLSREARELADKLQKMNLPLPW